MLIPGRISLYLSFEKGLADLPGRYSAQFHVQVFFKRFFRKKKASTTPIVPFLDNKIDKKGTYIKLFVDAFSRQIVRGVEGVSLLLLKVAL